jgi:hypothetical protein
MNEHMTKTVTDVDGVHIVREAGYGTQDGPSAYSFTRLRFFATCGDREFSVEVYMLDNRRQFRCTWAARTRGARWKIWRATFKSEAQAIAFAESTKIPQGLTWIRKTEPKAAAA